MRNKFRRRFITEYVGYATEHIKNDECFSDEEKATRIEYIDRKLKAYDSGLLTVVNIMDCISQATKFYEEI